MAAFPRDVDAIVTNAAGCGSAIKEYGLLFSGEGDRKRAESFSGLATDICVFLDRLGIVDPPAVKPVKVAYQDACHLAHAQGVRAAPRRLLSRIPGIEIVEPADWELCCGSAGIYNLEHPVVARDLGRRKARSLIDTGAEVVATGNIGCMTQILMHLEELGRTLPVKHTVEILAEAYDCSRGR